MTQALMPHVSVVLSAEYMIPVQKAISHVVLARKWEDGFIARPDMSMKWGEATRECEYSGGLWECVARNNPLESFCTITIYGIVQGNGCLSFILGNKPVDS